MLQNHCDSDEFTVVEDLHQSQAWKEMYKRDGPFLGDSRGLCGFVYLSMDLCGWHKSILKTEHFIFMWPLTLSVLNFLFHIRNNARSMFLFLGKLSQLTLTPTLRYW